MIWTSFIARCKLKSTSINESFINLCSNESHHLSTRSVKMDRLALRVTCLSLSKNVVFKILNEMISTNMMEALSDLHHKLFFAKRAYLVYKFLILGCLKEHLLQSTCSHVIWVLWISTLKKKFLLWACFYHYLKTRIKLWWQLIDYIDQTNWSLIMSETWW